MTIDEEGVAGSPLRRFRILQDGDLGLFEATSVDWFTPCRVQPLRRDMSETKARGSVSATTLGPIKLVHAKTSGSEMTVDYAQQEPNYVVSFALEGTNHISVGGEEAICSGLRAVVLSPNMVAGMRLSDGYSQLHITMERSALERHLERMLDSPVVKPIRFQVGMDLTTSALASWMRGVDAIIKDADEPAGLSAAAADIHPWSDFLMTGLLLAQNHNYSDRLLRRKGNFRPQSLKRAVELVDLEPASDLSLSRLCSVAGVGPRVLQRYFREYVGASPREYVKKVRLSRAHEDLLAGSGATVSEIALRWGFAHVPRFAAAYQERYGVLPSNTLRSS